MQGPLASVGQRPWRADLVRVLLPLTGTMLTCRDMLEISGTTVLAIIEAPTGFSV